MRVLRLQEYGRIIPKIKGVLDILEKREIHLSSYAELFTEI